MQLSSTLNLCCIIVESIGLISLFGEKYVSLSMSCLPYHILSDLYRKIVESIGLLSLFGK